MSLLLMARYIIEKHKFLKGHLPVHVFIHLMDECPHGHIIPISIDCGEFSSDEVIQVVGAQRVLVFATLRGVTVKFHHHQEHDYLHRQITIHVFNVVSLRRKRVEFSWCGTCYNLMPNIYPDRTARPTQGSHLMRDVPRIWTGGSTLPPPPLLIGQNVGKTFSKTIQVVVP